MSMTRLITHWLHNHAPAVSRSTDNDLTSAVVSRTGMTLLQLEYKYATWQLIKMQCCSLSHTYSSHWYCVFATFGCSRASLIKRVSNGKLVECYQWWHWRVIFPDGRDSHAASQPMLFCTKTFLQRNLIKDEIWTFDMITTVSHRTANSSPYPSSTEVNERLNLSAKTVGFLDMAALKWRATFPINLVIFFHFRRQKPI